VNGVESPRLYARLTPNGAGRFAALFHEGKDGSADSKGNTDPADDQRQMHPLLQFLFGEAQRLHLLRELLQQARGLDGRGLQLINPHVGALLTLLSFLCLDGGEYPELSEI
jgi:hypothetical protein